MKAYQVEEAAGLLAEKRSLLSRLNTLDELRSRDLALCENVRVVGWRDAHMEWRPAITKVDARIVIDATKKQLQQEIVNVDCRLRELGVS